MRDAHAASRVAVRPVRRAAFSWGDDEAGVGSEKFRDGGAKGDQRMSVVDPADVREQHRIGNAHRRNLASRPRSHRGQLRMIG